MYFLFRPILWFILLLVLVCLCSIGHYCSSWGYWVDWICDCCVGFFFVCPKVFFIFFRQTGKRDGPKYFFIEYYGLICKIILWRGPRIYIYIYIYIWKTHFIVYDAQQEIHITKFLILCFQDIH